MTSLPSRFTNETAARKHLEALLWPDGPVCPHCGVIAEATKLKGKSTRPGVYWCNACEKPFSVTVGTVFERSHIPLHKWLYASYLLASSKKGISSHQMHRMLGVTYKTAWFMMHRLREALKQDYSTPIGGSGKIVESDETYLGHKAGVSSAHAGYGHKMAVLSLVERGGPVRSMQIDKATKKTIRAALATHIHPESHLMTDKAKHYLSAPVAKHESVDHEREYVSGNIHTNTLEGYFSVFKRGMRGIYQHCGEQHLDRYLTEFDFRYNNREAVGVNDNVRTEKALKGIKGKRLTYRRIGGAEEAKGQA